MPPTGLYAALSEDAGAVWSAPFLVRATADGNQGYSSSVELDDGTIFTANYGSKLPQRVNEDAFRANGAPLSGPQELEGGGLDPTGVTGTLWRPPPALTR